MRRENGQAAVESALVLPLVVFTVLGMLQIFLMLQARMMAQYAVSRATRAGSLEQGSCRSMMHTALVSLLPTITRTDSPERLAGAFRSRVDNIYQPALDDGHDGHILELVRERPLANVIGQDGIELQGGDGEDLFFDQPHVGGPETNMARSRPLTLEVRMLYWYRLRIPFADWVLSRMFLAQWGLRDYTAVNPLITPETAHWTRSEAAGELDRAGEAWPGGTVSSTLFARVSRRQYEVPIVVTSTVRMLTPARLAFFTGGPLGGQGCPINPPYPGY